MGPAVGDGRWEMGDVAAAFWFLICFILSSVAGGFMQLAPEDGGQSEMAKKCALQVAYAVGVKAISDWSEMESEMGNPVRRIIGWEKQGGTNR
jgi:hypothetical protein